MLRHIDMPIVETPPMDEQSIRDAVDKYIDFRKIVHQEGRNLASDDINEARMQMMESVGLSTTVQRNFDPQTRDSAIRIWKRNFGESDEDPALDREAIVDNLQRHRAAQIERMEKKVEFEKKVIHIDDADREVLPPGLYAPTQDGDGVTRVGDARTIHGYRIEGDARPFYSGKDTYMWTTLDPRFAFSVGISASLAGESRTEDGHEYDSVLYAFRVPPGPVLMLPHNIDRPRAPANPLLMNFKWDAVYSKNDEITNLSTHPLYDIFQLRDPGQFDIDGTYWINYKDGVITKRSGGTPETDAVVNELADQYGADTIGIPNTMVSEDVTARVRSYPHPIIAQTMKRYSDRIRSGKLDNESDKDRHDDDYFRTYSGEADEIDYGAEPVSTGFGVIRGEANQSINSLKDAIDRYQLAQTAHHQPQAKDRTIAGNYNKPKNHRYQQRPIRGGRGRIQY